MNQQIQALHVEFIKNKSSSIVWITFLAFSLAPLMGGVFMVIMRHPEALARASGMGAKAKVMGFAANWDSYLSILTQAVGVGGVLLFGFVASWIFGREYAEGTVKDLLALPITRAKILMAKFTMYTIWCLTLVLVNLLIGALIGTFLQLPPVAMQSVSEHLTDYVITAVLTIPLGTPIAFLAIWSRGYLGPLGFVSLVLVLAQIIAATGYGHYFPWAVPGIYSGSAGEYKTQLDFYSYSGVLLTGVTGYMATVWYWQTADQAK